MIYSSSTTAVPEVGTVPRHVAIIMDGNGRWATKRFLPRVAGHVKGADAVRGVVETCLERGVEYLTLFAFSSENWRRPEEEVSMLMRLFVTMLEREVVKMHASDIRLSIHTPAHRLPCAWNSQATVVFLCPFLTEGYQVF